MDESNGLPAKISNPNLAAASVATQWKPGQSGNPNGRPKGSKNWSQIVQDMLLDEDFAAKVTGDMKSKPDWWQHIPNKNFGTIIAGAMLIKAGGGDKGAADWLRKTGYGDKLDITSDGEAIGEANATDAKSAEFNAFLSAKAKGQIAAPAKPADVPDFNTPGQTIPNDEPPAPLAIVDVPAIVETGTAAPATTAQVIQSAAVPPSQPTEQIIDSPKPPPIIIQATAAPTAPAPVQPIAVPIVDVIVPQQSGTPNVT